MDFALSMHNAPYTVCTVTVSKQLSVRAAQSFLEIRLEASRMGLLEAGYRHEMFGLGYSSAAAILSCDGRRSSTLILTLLDLVSLNH